MDSRNAWRLLDFVKDFLMHHRKFTPFQKIMFVSLNVGVLFLVLHNFWAFGITVTYGMSLYLSVKISVYLSTRKQFFPSHIIFIWFEKLDVVFRPILFPVAAQSNDHIPTVEDRKGPENKTGGGDIKENENKIDDKYFESAHGQQCRGLQHTVQKEVAATILEVSDKTDHQHAERSVTHTGVANAKVDQSAEKVESIEKQVYVELSHLVKLINKDFIESWYTLFSDDKSGLDAAEEVLHHAIDNLQDRVYKEQVLDIIQCIIIMYRNHVKLLKQSKLMFRALRRRKSSVKPSKSESGIPSMKVFTSVEDCYASKMEIHPATKSVECEQLYLKAVTECLLNHLLPEDISSTKTVTCALKEILTCNVLQSFLSLLSETTFLHECIIRVTSDEQIGVCAEGSPVIIVTETSRSDEKVQSILVNKTPNTENTVEQESAKSAVATTAAKAETETRPEGTNTLDPSSIKEATASVGAKWKEDTVLHQVRRGMCNECNRLSSKDRDKISPRPHTCALGSNPVFFEKKVSDSDTLSQCSVSSSYEDKPVFSVQGEAAEEDSPNEFNVPQVVNTSTKAIGYNTNHKLDTVSEVQGCQEATVLEAKHGQEIEGKAVSSLFNFSLPNPFNSLSRPSFLDRKRSSTSLQSDCEETAGEATLDIPKSQSSGEDSSERASPTTPSEGLLLSCGAPSIFQDIRMDGTEIAKEAGRDATYTLYVIEYEALYQSEDNETLVHKTGSVKRRYSEFVNLQARLEDNSAYRRSLKDVKRPKKMMPPLPFGNMGKEAVENRKGLLEQFLKDLIKKFDICNGEELKQFLGYSGDGHLAFVRKLPENTGQGINQRLVKTMSGVFDKFMEGIQEIPSLPQQLPRLLSDLRNDKDEDVKPLLDLDQLDIEFVFEETSAHECKFDASLDAFLPDTDVDTTLGTSMLGWQNQQLCPTPPTSIKYELGTSSSRSTKRRTSTPRSPKKGIEMVDSEDSLTDTVLDTLTELLHGHDNWLCRETVMHTTRVLLGSGLHRLLQTKLESFLTPEMCTHYLVTLRTTFWPNDQLSSDARPKLTDHEREIRKKQATRCLRDFLPGILRPVLGEEDFNIMIDEAMGSIEYEHLNRHFWYTVLDVILERLFPEITSPDHQRKLSEALTFH